MRTAYVTLDEVNASKAEELAASAGQIVYQVDLRSPHLVTEPFLVLDLDHLPAEELPRLLALLLSRPRGRQSGQAGAGPEGQAHRQRSRRAHQKEHRRRMAR